MKSYFPALSLELLSTGAEAQSGTVEGLHRELRPGNMSRFGNGQTDKVMPAVLASRVPKPRLMNVASLVDCQVGGIIVIKP